MTPEQAIGFVLFAIVAAITPGPSNLILTSTGSTVGIRRGLPCLGGVALGMGLLIFVVALGLGGVVLAIPLIVPTIKLCGAGFLLWLAWKIAIASPAEATRVKTFVGFWQAAAFQWVNPKSWLVGAGAVGTFFHAGASSTLIQSLAFGALFVVVALPSCFVWLAFGAAVQRLLRTKRAARAFNVTMGVLLAGSVLLLLK
jgi:threonine/homoserine/homoserine lactone efflux protein